MDYVSYIKKAAAELISTLNGLSMSTKIAILAVLVFLALIVYLRSRDTAKNNLRRAMGLHKKAVELHEKGKTEEATERYRQAEKFREKAEAQK